MRASAPEALAIHRTTESAVEQLVDYLLLARIDARTGRPTGADSSLRAARNLADSLATPDVRGRVALAAADIADRRRRSRDVLAALDSATVDLALAAPVAEARVHTLRARALARPCSIYRSGWAKRRTSGRAGRNRRVGHASHELHVGERRSLRRPVIVLLRQGRTDEAFAVADAALVGCSSIWRRRGDLAALGAARELLEAEALLDRIDRLMERLRDRVSPRRQERAALADVEDTELNAQLQRARNDYEALLERANTGDAPGAALLGTRTVASTTIRSLLLPGELLLEYFVAADQLLTFVVSRDTTRVIATPVTGADLATRVRVARDLVARRDTSGGRLALALESLYGTLIEPVRRAGGLEQATRLVIIPHGPLTYLPFAALRDLTMANTSWSVTPSCTRRRRRRWPLFEAQGRRSKRGPLPRWRSRHSRKTFRRPCSRRAAWRGRYRAQSCWRDPKRQSSHCDAHWTTRRWCTLLHTVS